METQLGRQRPLAARPEPEISVVIPCLNEAAAIVQTVERARAGLAAAGLVGEVVVVDNASEDSSAELARSAGAKVVFEPRRGYGSAYLTGLAAAQGQYVVMADADGTYDLRLIGELVGRLRDGADIVLGSRFKGTIHPGAMPWPNRYIGNPLLTAMLNVLFNARVSDAHCGLRAIRRDVVPQLKLRATGMEFASEMVVKAGKQRLRIDEVPIEYHPRIGDSKLSRFSDAWRHIRFMLVHSPMYLFVVPGAIATVGGIAALVALAALWWLGDEWTGVSVTAAVLAIVGVGVIELGLFARTYAVIYLGERDARLEKAWGRLRLEHGLAVAAGTLALGLVITLVSFFDRLKDPRLGVLGLALIAIGFQCASGSFFLSILGLSDDALLRREVRPPADRT